LQRYFGVASMGTGYTPLNSGFYELRNNVFSGLTVSYPNTWTLLDMFEGSRLSTKPYLSPHGHWLESSTVGATATVTFPGNGVDVYWLSDTAGGRFSIIADNVAKDTVNTAGSRGVLKTTVAGLTSGNHTVQLRVTSVPVSGNVTLLGFDARNDLCGAAKRSVVHNWGNGYAATVDFLGIDSTVFVTGLQKLSPDIVVVLLGTNDHLQDSRSAPELKANLKAIINRVKAAGFAGKIMLVSTFMTNNTSGATFIPQYRATSWPQAADETGVAYWDMSAWYGAWNSALMLDANHCNQTGAKKIAVEMLRQILTKFPPVSIAETRSRTAAEANVRPLCASGRLFAPVTGQGRLRIEITDIKGAVIKKTYMNASQGTILHCGPGHLSNGIYIVNVNGNGTRVGWRLPVTH
jgi:lysophospholipase L1-like esterase